MADMTEMVLDMALTNMVFDMTDMAEDSQNGGTYDGKGRT